LTIARSPGAILRMVKPDLEVKFQFFIEFTPERITPRYEKGPVIKTRIDKRGENMEYAFGTIPGRQTFRCVIYFLGQRLCIAYDGAAFSGRTNIYRCERKKKKLFQKKTIGRPLYRLKSAWAQSSISGIPSVAFMRESMSAGCPNMCTTTSALSPARFLRTSSTERVKLNGRYR